MKGVAIVCLIFVAYLATSEAMDLIVGTSFNNILAWQQKLSVGGFPFKKRIKEVFYSDPERGPIKGVIARDIAHSGAIASITAGGLGSTYVNVRLKSERGDGLSYQVEIYV